MRFERRPVAASAVLVAVALLGAACTGGDGGGRIADPPGPGIDADDTSPFDASLPTSTTSDGPAAVPVVGGTLRLGIARVESLDPAAASPESPSSSIVADLLFDGLTAMPRESASAEPAIAERWDTLDGGRTWRFLISPTARFSDGRAVSAADAELSIERVVSRGGGTLTASRLDALNGYDEFLAAGGRDRGADLTGVRAVDATTLELILERPMATLPELLSAPAYGIVSRTGVEADGAAFGSGPTVSSGPFRLSQRDGDTISLVRAPARDAYVDQIDLRQHDDLAAAFDDFESGRLDWTLVPPSRVDVAAERFGTEAFGPFQAELFFGFNLADPTFADVRFRQAIAQAIDRRAIVNAVYFGVAEPLSSIVPAGVAGGDPSRCGAGCDHDPDAARALLRAAFPGGAVVPTVAIDFADGADETAVAGIIEQNLAAVGIPVVLRPHPPAEFGAFAVSGGQGMVSLGWIGVHPSPEDYVERLFRSGSEDNLTGFGDPEVDALLDRAASTFDPVRRLDLLGEAEAAVLAQAPSVSLAQFQVLAVASDRVNDLDLAVTGTFDGEAVWLTP